MTSTTVVLHAGTVTSENSASLPDRGLVGSGAVWDDGSDSTYFATSITGGSGTPYPADALFDPLVLPVGATVTDVHLNLRASSVATSTGTGSAHIIFQSPPGGFGFSGVGPTYPSPKLSGALVDGVLVTSSTPTDYYTLIDATDAAVFGLTMDDLIAALVAGANVNVYAAATELSSGQVSRLRIYELNLEVTYEVLDLPCDTDVALDLSTAQFTEVDSMPFGQYGDGVIYGYTRSPATTPSYPDFFFATEALDPAKPYAVTVTFDPSSAHDSGGRSFTLTGVQPGSETDFNTVDGFPIGDLYDGSSNTDDSVTVRIGPGIGGWDDATYGVAAGFSRLFFETDRDGAVSAITIRKVCTSFAPPLRLTNRDDMFASARRLTGSSSRQASNRLTGYL